MDILTRVKIIDREADGYCKVGNIDNVTPEGLHSVRVENWPPQSGTPPFTFYEGLRADQIHQTFEASPLEIPVGIAQLLDVIRETHGYNITQCRSVLDYALRSEAVIELLLKTIAEDDDISPDELAKHSIEFQSRDEDYYGKEYAHLRKLDENEIPQPKEIAEEMRAMLGKKGATLRQFDDLMKELGAIDEVERQAIKEKAYLVSELIKRREQLGWTQAQLAERAGLKQSAVARLENAPTIPHMDTIQMVAIALGLSISMRLTKDDTAL